MNTVDIFIARYQRGDEPTDIQLNRAEEIIGGFKSSLIYDNINKVIELYNAKNIFDLALKKSLLNESALNKYNHVIREINSTIAKFVANINGENFNGYYDNTESYCKCTFWELIEYYEVFLHISKNQFFNIISHTIASIGLILQCRKIVLKFDKEFVQVFKEKTECAELIIRYYSNQDGFSKNKLYMPKSLSQDDIKSIFQNYIDSENANPNYLRLIAYLKRCNGLSIGDKVRYKAYKKYCDYWNLSSSNNKHKMQYGVNIIFTDDISKNDSELTCDGNIMTCSYKISWFNNNLDYPTLMNNFIHLFGYVDEQNVCTFLSISSKLGIFESIMTHSSKDYMTGIDYNLNNMRSSAQMSAYINFLKSKNIYLENIFKWFFESYLPEEFSVKGFSYTAPHKNASILEKILVLVPQLDGIMKQFILYQTSGILDREYFEFSSDSCKLSEAKSLLEKKYVYAKDKNLIRAMHLFYSSQSLLYYTDGEEYDNFPELILNKQLKFENFKEYAHEDLKFLLENNYIFYDSNGNISIDYVKSNIMRILFNNEVLSYHYFKKEPNYIEQINEWISRGILSCDNLLFSRQEIALIDYMLNVQQFTNGPELRNKYAHGVFALSKTQQEKDYISLLKIMTLIIIKINEEFCLLFPEDKENN